VTKLKLVLSEAVTNIIRHSYGGNEERTILLSLASEEDRLRISVHDVGLPFDEKSYRPPDLGEAAESGYGVYIIHEYMDEVTYTSTPGEGNTLVMYKRIE
jgi:anti-sigma regulatory factor (Ser/Thr protein kinase)